MHYNHDYGSCPFEEPKKPRFHDEWYEASDGMREISSEFPIVMRVLEQMYAHRQEKYHLLDRRGSNGIMSLDEAYIQFGLSFLFPSARVLYGKLLERDLVLPPVEVQSPVVRSLERPRVVFFPVVSGPRETDVVCYEGEEGSLFLNANGVDYYLAIKKKNAKVLDVPLPIIHSYLMSLSKTGPLHNAQFYESDLAGYSTWSFKLHEKTLKKVLGLIPAGSIVTAPGDGVGLVARLWPGKTISGDRVITQMSSLSTHCETIFETLVRGRAEGSKHVVISYCQQFMTDSEMQLLLESGMEVFFIEANDRILMRADLFVLGPGVYCTKKYKVDEIFNSDRDRAQSILYSENLLQEGYVVSHWTPPLYYVYLMSPFLPLKYAGAVVRPFPERNGPKGPPDRYFAYSVREARELHMQGHRVYFYGLGMIFSGVTFLATPFGVHLEPRRIYHFDSIVDLVITKGNVGFEQSRTGFYVWAHDRKDSTIRVTVQEKGQKKSCGDIHFGESASNLIELTACFKGGGVISTFVHYGWEDCSLYDCSFEEIERWALRLPARAGSKTKLWQMIRSWYMHPDNWAFDAYSPMRDQVIRNEQGFFRVKDMKPVASWWDMTDSAPLKDHAEFLEAVRKRYDHE